jgi:hypothetical protein
LGKCSVSSPKHFIARFELRDVLADGFNRSSKINAKTYIFWFTQPYAKSAHDIWRALNEMPVIRIDRHRANLHQDLIIRRDWLFNVFDLEIRQTIIATDDCFHRITRSSVATVVRRSPIGDEYRDEDQ